MGCWRRAGQSAVHYRHAQLAGDAAARCAARRAGRQQRRVRGRRVARRGSQAPHLAMLLLRKVGAPAGNLVPHGLQGARAGSAPVQRLPDDNVRLFSQTRMQRNGIRCSGRSLQPHKHSMHRRAGARAAVRACMSNRLLVCSPSRVNSAAVASARSVCGAMGAAGVSGRWCPLRAMASCQGLQGRAVLAIPTAALSSHHYSRRTATTGHRPCLVSACSLTCPARKAALTALQFRYRSARSMRRAASASRAALSTSPEKRMVREAP